jgi:enoyl-CoA hydratase
MENSTIFSGEFNFHNTNKDLMVQYDLDTKTAVVLINRPKQLNALNRRLIESLSDFFNQVEKNKQIRSIIISGMGNKSFVAGADIKEFQNFNKEEALNLSFLGKEQLFNKITQFSKPVIAAINGYALGGGLELALACHLRIASDNAKLGLPECSLGLIPGYSGTQKLPQIISKNIAMEMILTSQILDAQRSLQLNLVNYVVPQGELAKRSLEIGALCSRISPESASAAIKSINSCYSQSGEETETEEFSKLFETTNFKEGVSAFLEKRKPNFN